eukprot:CAMPEP_0183303424 /NCGR_PEP_ID=MMETSP0160_2-20130417/8870_1 /TAXON_ID=2839 ORGANISM="Odontella Sinensis, Strain Grunow 1884" /NCGR_SAMPLE_ID=MMETSP0160_2 /ASSEMBLY_ACC=CAM_ASM_000250 /LENGTH=332 /DNA_ID=CAMNT_0025466327 /DNA_START=86 /DNA_END=1084 /DNA_ORIENTATION=-
MAYHHPKPIRGKGEILIKVKAVALAPGDVRVMKGHCNFFQSPRAFPYIPGGDLSGVVEEADVTSHFKKGDDVVAMFELPRPLGALAEFSVVKENLVELAPSTVSAPEAACLTSSAMSALKAVKKYVKKGCRILILGASGGVGTFLVQLAKNSGAHVVATSTDEELLKSLGADEVIDYKASNKWWDIAEFQSNPFDVIFDLGVGRREAWEKAKSSNVLKNGWHKGKFVSFTGDEPNMRVQSAWQAVTFGLNILRRPIWTSLWPFVPRYVWFDGLAIEPGILAELAALVDGGKLRVVLDTVSSPEFSAEAVKKGFHLMEKRHAHGKVVIKVSKV